MGFALSEMELTSPTFQQRGNIPTKYTGEGEDASPLEGHGIHHYFFWVLALDAEVDLESGLSLEELLREIEPNVTGMNRLVGTYSRG